MTVMQNDRPGTDGAAKPVVAVDVVRRYGEGDTAVDALRGVSWTSPLVASPPSWDLRVRQVDADAHPRRP